MRPALSVIFFTTLSGAGYGLLAWLGVLLATLGYDLPAGLSSRAATPQWMTLLLVLLLTGCALAGIGLLSSLLHLGKPGRAWRALSQWRTSWLSREGVMALLTFVPLSLLLALVLIGVIEGTYAPLRFAACAPVFGIAMSLLAIITVICTAMIYASLPPIPAWRHRLVVPVYVVFALLTGGLLLGAIVLLSGYDSHALVAIWVSLTAIVLAAMKFKYWRDIDATPLPATRGDAVGLPGRDVSVFEGPHTEPNYITREMAFVLARRHARALRWAALTLFGLVPVACMAPL
ncbi:MAG: DmsC/YnfH family molybdoenzyme membrane anchor subunit, partial [Roseiflexaceae bacterium]